MFKKSFLLAGIAFMIVGCGNSENNNIVSVNTNGTTIVDNSNLSDTLNDYVITDLNDTEEADLLVLREEEKLAHDVYIALYDLYHQNIFSNIAGAEQTHTDAVLLLINRYELDDPVDDNLLGDFEDNDLLQLYHDLVGLGDDNLTAALIVGATIEDLDIHDIEEMMARTDNEDILLVYELLQKGSRNHLRSFISQLELIAPDYTYTPQYISEDAYNAIINSPMETGQ